ncbi:MAG: class B sortase [Oscillospiraceae bacterium]|nr:class B sortase [Oscillospiraceae bacterium]
MSDQNREYQNPNGAYPYYGQPQVGQPQGGYYPPTAAPQQYYQPQAGYYPPAPTPQYYQPQAGAPQYYQPPTPYGQPYYPAPPAPVPPATPYEQAQASMPKGEVIIQSSPFEEYGFTPDDSTNSGHDFGGIMDDVNQDDGFNVFNSQTPNFDLNEVETKAQTKTEEDSAFSSNTTPNYNIDAVNEAANSTADRDIFSNATPVFAVEDVSSKVISVDAVNESATIVPIPEAPTVSSTPSEPVSAMNFMASMQSMLSSMGTGAAPVAPTAQAEPAKPAEVPTDPQPTVVTTPAPTVDEPVVTATQPAYVQPAAPAKPGEPQKVFNVAAPAPANVPVTPKADPVVPPVAPTPVAPAVSQPATPVVPPVAPTPVAPAASQPATSVVPPVAPPPVAPAASQPATPVVPPVTYAQPDYVKSAPKINNTIQDISSTTSNASSQGEKGPEYWAYMNSLLNNFDDGQVHKEFHEPSYANMAPEVITEPKPVVTQPVAQAAHIKQDIPMDKVQSPYDMGNQDNSWLIPENDEYEDPKEVKRAKKAQLAEEKAALKAQKAEEKAALKAQKAEEKAALKAQKAEARAAKKASKKNKDVDEVPENNFYVNEDGDSNNEIENTSKFKRILAAIFPMKGDPVKEIIRKIVVIVAALVFIICMIRLLVIFIGTRSNASDTSELSGIMSSSETSETDWSSIYNKYPDVQFPSGMQPKFADLYVINNDLVGWIRIPGLDIDHPVVQTTDDSYYLKHNFKKEKSDYGTVFLSSGNSIDYLDLNTVIYGHSMRRDTQMFTPLKEYKSIEGFKKSPIIEFNTIYGDYKFKVFSVFITNGSTAGDNGYVFNYTFSNLASIESFAGFVAEIKQRSLYDTGVDIQPDDRLITLSTCTYEFSNARLVVIGRMVRDGESEEVDISKAVVNSNPRYPQAWYDANSKTNPYANYDKWVPTTA